MGQGVHIIMHNTVWLRAVPRHHVQVGAGGKLLVSIAREVGWANGGANKECAVVSGG